MNAEIMNCELTTASGKFKICGIVAKENMNCSITNGQLINTALAFCNKVQSHLSKNGQGISKNAQIIRNLVHRSDHLHIIMLTQNSLGDNTMNWEYYLFV